ncbi:MAG: hypothetical protein O3A00_00035 [Planctomycetota bacterium]|nr:hypothetical protein [Planctomycetota bacterium]
MKTTIALMTAVGLTGLMLGCGDAKSGSKSDSKSASAAPAAHPTEGPHHGHLIELGKEEYHAEVTHPEDEKAITIYVLDASATKAVPIDAADVVINVSHDGTPEQFKLTASPDTGDPAGKSSRFVSTDAELVEHFGEAFIHGTLVLTINGKSFRGEIDIHHDGKPHDHKTNKD